MPIYQRGSTGNEVKRIQERLQSRGHYHGPLDGIYGGGTESAVVTFQQSEEIQVDGIVGPQTWAHLFDQEAIPSPSLLEEPLSRRSLALTGAFETGSPRPDCFAELTGDFDGQGLSLGCLQWNLGQGSLQPLLQHMEKHHPEVMEEVFGRYHEELLAVLDVSRSEQLEWARSIQDANRRTFVEPWRGLFKSLGRREEFQKRQVEAADRLYDEAVELTREYNLWSERAVALLFDIKVQNGRIPRAVQAQILRDFDQLVEEGKEKEVVRMRIIANRRAEAAKPRWIEDVRARKLTIANGQGTVHGRWYDLEEEYGLRLTEAI